MEHSMNSHVITALVRLLTDNTMRIPADGTRPNSSGCMLEVELTRESHLS
jgi:hypothetical protein